MIKRIGLFILVFVVSCASFYGQSKADIIKFGDNEYKKENYASAAFFYKSALEKKGISNGSLVHPYEAKAWVAPLKKALNDSTNINKVDSGGYGKDAVIVHKLANAYRLNHDYLNAEKWYEIAIKNPTDNIEEDVQNSRFWYGEALMKNGKYDEASKQFEIYKKEAVDIDFTKRADQNIIGCFYAQDQQSTIKDVNVSRADTNLNFGTASFSANYFGDEMSIIFASSGAKGIITDAKKQDPNYLSDFYLSQKMIDGGYSEASNIGIPLNSENNEGAGVLSIDRSTFYFTRKSGTNNSDVSIWVSKNFNNQWLKPLKLDQKVNLSGYKSMHPALSMEGDVLYFSSNRPGGKGGMDIWYCKIDDYGGLSDPVNMGEVINTVGNEVTPFFNYFTKTLYFSSDALAGIGGLDIYKSTYNEDEDTWSTSKNLGKPFNSNKDDSYFIISKDQKQGFLTSDRETCDCGDNYEGATNCYKIYQFGQPNMEFSISGTVFNAETNEPIANALITVKDIRGEREPFFITTDAKGNYQKELKVGWELFMKAQKARYFGDAASISTTGLTESKHFLQDFFLSPIPLGEIEIPGIEYDFDAATLRPKSKEILDKLVEFLDLNNNISIEIRSHTDTRGNDKYNLRLSQRRAASVVKYLVAHKIDKARLKAVGMGEKEPLEDCSKYPECNQGKADCPCHQKNRRTTFKTTSEEFKKVFKGK